MSSSDLNPRFGHFSPDCHLYSTANTMCPTEDGRKRKGHPTEELCKYADPLVHTHNVFKEAMHPFACTLENPATGRLLCRKVSGRISSRLLWLDLEFNVLIIKIYKILYKSFQCRVDVNFFDSYHELILYSSILLFPSSPSRWWGLYMLCVELTIADMVQKLATIWSSVELEGFEPKRCLGKA
jgi:hypothetical protein